jgi:hypothetical protein
MAISTKSLEIFRSHFSDEINKRFGWNNSGKSFSSPIGSIYLEQPPYWIPILRLRTFALSKQRLIIKPVVDGSLHFGCRFG